MNLFQLIPEDVIKLLMIQVTPCSFFILLCTSKYFHIIKRKFSKHEIIKSALRHGTPDTYQFLKSKNFHEIADLSYIIQHHGNIELFRWLRNRGCSINSDYGMSIAAIYGNIKIMKELLNDNDSNKETMWRIIGKYGYSYNELLS